MKGNRAGRYVSLAQRPNFTREVKDVDSYPGNKRRGGVKTAALGAITRQSQPTTGGRNSSVGSVLGSLSSLMQRRGFHPPLRFFSGTGEFAFGVKMGSDSIPPKLFRMRV